MTERELVEGLRALLNGPDVCDELGLDELNGGPCVCTFEDAGVLTFNEGLVVRFPGGTEFQVTVVRSRAGGETK